MCRVLMVHFSGLVAWLKEPLSARALEDARQTELIQQAWADSGKVYGYRKLADDLRDAGKTCSENRVARLASIAGIAAQIGYKRRPGRYGGKPAVVADNTLDRQFEVDAPDTVWVADITYIRTHEGWSYLSVVIDLFSRRVVALSWFACKPLPVQHEPSWKLPRQSRCRELLPTPKTRTDQAKDIPDTRSCKAGCVRLHRDVLQPNTQAYQQRHAVTG
jgi:hypothetical protein